MQVTRMTEQQEAARQIIIEQATSAIFDKLDAVLINVERLQANIAGEVRELAGRSPGDKTNPRQYRLPEGVAACTIASQLRRWLGEYPQCWDEAVVDEYNANFDSLNGSDTFDREQLIKDTRAEVVGKLASIWREVEAAKNAEAANAKQD